MDKLDWETVLSSFDGGELEEDLSVSGRLVDLSSLLDREVTVVLSSLEGRVIEVEVSLSLLVRDVGLLSLVNEVVVATLSVFETDKMGAVAESWSLDGNQEV